MDEALEKLSAQMPFTAEAAARLDGASEMLIDAFLKWFENVVEAGGKLFRAALHQAGDDHRGLGPSEIELRLESYGFIESAERWRQLVGVRNRTVHAYADDPEDLAEALTEAYQAAMEASRIVRGLLEHLRRRFPDSSPVED